MQIEKILIKNFIAEIKKFRTNVTPENEETKKILDCNLKKYANLIYCWHPIFGDYIICELKTTEIIIYPIEE